MDLRDFTPIKYTEDQLENNCIKINNKETVIVFQEFISKKDPSIKLRIAVYDGDSAKENYVFIVHGKFPEDILNYFKETFDKEVAGTEIMHIVAGPQSHPSIN